jgi:hypothetical protein
VRELLARKRELLKQMLRLLSILSLPITVSSGGTDGQLNGRCIRSRYDIDVSVFTSRHAKTPSWLSLQLTLASDSLKPEQL